MKNIKNSVTSIVEFAFEICDSLENVFYNGTIEEWNEVTKESSCFYNIPATKVVCLDGNVTL